MMVYRSFGMAQDRLRFATIRSYYSILISSFITGFIHWLIFLTVSKTNLWIELITFSLFLSNLLLLFRVGVRQYIRNNSKKSCCNILVYGTSDNAIDLVNAMSFSKKYHVAGLVNDRPTSHQKFIAGLQIFQISELKKIIKKLDVELIVLASEQLSEDEYKSLIRELDKLQVSVTSAPTMDKAFNYEVQLKSIKPEEFLDRSERNQIDVSVETQLRDKVILISGAAGSIGSELCYQIMKLKPQKIIAIDISEYNLYQLREHINELFEKDSINVLFEYIIGSVQDKELLSKVFGDNNIDLVYHAAAYKHVPMVEENICSAVRNNIIGTLNLVDLSVEKKVDKFILVSTDKAVRPTNIMGATKRFCEIICEHYQQKGTTNFAMVRFGNVLGSSGSVIPKFKEQIKNGGPVTVTDPNVTRYFMSLSEAVSLILQAGYFSKGGEVFLLEMNEPVKIVELASSMIRYHGLKPVINSENQKTSDREIEIEFTGLRAGEKLYEELLVDKEAQKTQHEKIFCITEPLPDWAPFEAALKKFNSPQMRNDAKGIRNILRSLELEYNPENAIDVENSSTTPHLDSNPSVDNEYLIEEPDAEAFELKRQSTFQTVFLKLAHICFFFARGMTLGVRVAVFNEKDEVLLVKHTYMPGWHFPGGGVDTGEVVLSAAKRELFEETGVKDVKFYGGPQLYLNSGVSKRDQITFYKADTTTLPILNPTSAEISSAEFFSLNKLPSDVESGTLRRLREMQKDRYQINQTEALW